MANTFVLIAQQPLEFKGQHYEPGDRFIADGYEAAPMQIHGMTIEAPPEEQRAHGAAQRGTVLRTTAVTPVPVKRPRGRPRKTQTSEAPTYQRRDLQAEE